MNDRIANDLIRYAELVEDGALISPEEMNCASLMRIAAEALMSLQDGAQPAVAEQHKQRSVSEHLEPVAYRCIVVDVDYSMDTAAILIQDTRDYEFNDGQYWLSTTPYVATPRPQPQSEARGLSQSKPLTDEQIFVIKCNWITTPFVNHLDFARAIEAAHGITEEKNA